MVEMFTPNNFTIYYFGSELIITYNQNPLNRESIQVNLTNFPKIEETKLQQCVTYNI